MSELGEVIERLRGVPLIDAGEDTFRLRCRLEAPASPAEIYSAQITNMPEELLSFWKLCREAWLFEDVDYGQWGLHILSPAQSTERTALERSLRSHEFTPEDVVFGEFLGDQELVVFSPSEGHGALILIALPLDPRQDWYRAATELSTFLALYANHSGDKYWEH